MQTISIQGNADTKPLVYALAYVANNMCSTAILTKDTSYRRLINGDILGELENITINTAPVSSSEIPLAYKSFDLVIGVSCNENPVIKSDINIRVVSDKLTSDFKIKSKELKELKELETVESRNTNASDTDTQVKISAKSCRRKRNKTNADKVMLKENNKEMVEGTADISDSNLHVTRTTEEDSQNITVLEEHVQTTGNIPEKITESKSSSQEQNQSEDSLHIDFGIDRDEVIQVDSSSVTTIRVGYAPAVKGEKLIRLTPAVQEWIHAIEVNGSWRCARISQIIKLLAPTVAKVFGLTEKEAAKLFIARGVKRK